MRALITSPGSDGTAKIADVPEPQAGEVLVRTIAVGVCGTDREIISNLYGAAPPGRDHLILEL